MNVVERKSKLIRFLRDLAAFEADFQAREFSLDTGHSPRMWPKRECEGGCGTVMKGDGLCPKCWTAVADMVVRSR